MWSRAFRSGEESARPLSSGCPAPDRCATPPRELLTPRTPAGALLITTGPMATYYVNKNAQTNGDHEVHTSTCSFLPATENRLYLGNFTTCDEAVREAKKSYTQVNGCFYCSKACHTG